jgi:hypothetical protein
VHYRYNPQGLFVWREGDEIVPRVRKAQRTRGEIAPTVALMRKGHKRLNGRLNLIDYPICGIRTVFGYIFP